MTVPGLDPPASFDAWELANWIEETMVLSGDKSWSRTAILESFPSGSEPDQAEVDFGFAEIARRCDVAPDIYPFQIDETRSLVQRRDIDARVYEFLVIAGLAGAAYRKRSQHIKVNAMFDLLVREAIKNYFGGVGAEAVRFCYPTRDGRPKSLLKATPWLAKKMGLEIVTLRGLDDDDKDAGVDVVAWRPFAGGGGAFEHVLMQNTLALDYKRKPGDITPTRWLKMIDFGVLPSIGLAVPFAVEPGSKDFARVSDQAMIVLNRLRLTEYLNGVDLSSYPEWDSIGEWVPKQRAATLTALGKAAKSAGRKKKPTGRARRRDSHGTRSGALDVNDGRALSRKKRSQASRPER
jgi:hypothetical protein